jgi:hypothetical protein
MDVTVLVMFSFDSETQTYGSVAEPAIGGPNQKQTILVMRLTWKGQANLMNVCYNSCCWAK